MDHDKDKQFLKERAATEFINQWKKLNKQESTADIPKIIAQIKAFEQIQYSNRAIVLFSAKGFKPLYWGGNFEKLFGYNSDEIKLWNIPFFFKSIIWEHIDFPLKIIKWNKQMDQVAPLPEDTISHSYFCGLKTKHKAGHEVRLFIDQVILKTENNQPTLSLVYLQDVQHLMKDSFYWVRYERGDSADQVRFYRSSGQKKEFLNILSPREKEILEEIAKGADSKTISEKLNISPSTVTTHRKNMIARSGARNTTALIQLCRLCNAI